MNIKHLKELASDISVLYVEDDENISTEFVIYLRKLFKKVIFKKNGQEGLEEYQKNPFDLIITDIQMPIMNGLEMVKKIKEINSEQNIIITSAYSDPEKFISSIKIGVDGYILKPVDFNNLNQTLFKIVKKIKTFQEHTQYKERLKQLLHKTIDENIALELEKIDYYEQTLFALIDIIDNRDSYTGKHSLRVAQYSQSIARELGYSEHACQELYKAGILHDIGKVAIPDSLLLKPSGLTQEEYLLIQKHVEIGYHMLNQIPMFKKISTIINAHHERRDGSGYPNALKGDEIPQEATIMGIADSFDAMTTSRIYKHKKSVQEALDEITSLSKKHFIPHVVDAAVKVLKNVTIDSSINQIPKSRLEHERFSYFYKDNLTGLYNEAYLDFILSQNPLKNKLRYLNLILLDHFGKYNKKHGWTEGNELIIEISKKITSLYNHLMIFRIHGDDFVILTSNKEAFDEKKLENLTSILKNTGIKINTKAFDIEKNEIDSMKILETLL